jgi:hypothetical protein
MHARSIHASELKGLGLSVNTFIRPSDSPRSNSGVATYLARTRLDAFISGTTETKIDSVVTVNGLGLVSLFLSFAIASLLTLNHF